MASNLHVRSNSLPSASHPSSTRVQEELNKLNTFEATSTSASAFGLSLLENLYISLDGLLSVSSTQKAIFHHQGEEILDGSFRLLDICGIIRDMVMQIKENVQSLHSALRRRKENSNIEKSVAEYNSFSKKMKKNIKKLITSLKQLERKFGASSLLNNEEVISVVREVIVMNMFVFQSLLSFLAGPPSKLKAAKWMNKLMHKGEVNSKNSNELQCVDAALNTILNEGVNGSNMQVAYGRLETLEDTIESIEIALENVFRCLVKTRTSLLNIMTQ